MHSKSLQFFGFVQFFGLYVSYRSIRFGEFSPQIHMCHLA